MPTSLENLIAAVGRENAILDLSPPGPGPQNAPSAPPASPARGGVPGVHEAGSEEPAALSPPSPPRGGAGGEAPEFAIAGRTPRVALFPHSLEALCETLAAADAHGLAIAPYGGGTQIGIGAPPARLDAAVVTRRLNRVIDYQPDDMTVTVEAGLTLAELQETLGRRRQFLPLDPPLADRATIGGTVAADASGPWRAGFGAARDWLIGVRIVGADGQLVKGGGRVVKNVAGYDLCKLYTGSLGTLGVLAELTFKVMPLPETSAMAALPLDLPQVEPLLAALMDSDLAPAALELFGAGADPAGAAPEGGLALLARFDGPREAVEWQLAELEAMAARSGIVRHLSTLTPDDWQRVRDWPAGPWEWLAMAGALSSDVAALVEAGQRLAATAGVPLEIAARAATGAIFFGARGPLTSEAARELTDHVRGEAVARGGSLVILNAAPELREGLDHWGALGPELRLMKEIKAQLDPNGTLNPGRFVGGI
jgi:glycolate dehydrogenase FAD-binding subunit